MIELQNKYKGLLSILGLVIIVLVIILAFRVGKTYVVTFNTQGGTIYASVNVTLNGTVQRPNDPVLMGYLFVDWYDEDTGELFDFSKPITRDTTIKAVYESIEDLEE